MKLYESFVDASTNTPRTVCGQRACGSAATPELLKRCGTPPLQIFIDGSFKLESGDAERIAVNHVATTSQVSSSGGTRGRAQPAPCARKRRGRSLTLHRPRRARARAWCRRSAVITYLQSQRNAVQALRDRITVLLNFLLDVEQGPALRRLPCPRTTTGC